MNFYYRHGFGDHRIYFGDNSGGSIAYIVVSRLVALSIQLTYVRAGPGVPFDHFD